MRIRFGPTLTISLVLSLRVLGATKADPWENLMRVTRHRAYTFVDRESNCVTGQILDVTERSVTIMIPGAKSTTIERKNALRVIDGHHLFDVIYSGKSSWSDVEGLPPKTKEQVRVLTKDGREYEGKLVSTSDAEMTLIQTTGNMKLIKEDIAQVYYVRYKPLSEGAEHSAQEMFVVDPRLWPHFFNISARFPVLLYDSSIPEDDSPVQCKNKP
jgi:hypothetical protein